jgi:hypothetical protein
MTELIAQVGGFHYGPIAVRHHWDLMAQYDIDYLTACGTKYVYRYDQGKGTPRLDLEKGVSYFRKRISLGQAAPRLVPLTDLASWFVEQRLAATTKTIILTKALVYGDLESLALAADLTQALAELNP